MKPKMKNILIQMYILLFRLIGSVLPKNKKLIVFESFLGKQYSDNPRAIYEYLRKHHFDFEMVWSADKQSTETFEKHDVRYVRRLSVGWIFLMNRATYWVSNSRLPLWIPKSKQTVYLQTWHGTPLKKLALDMEEVHMPGEDAKEYKQEFIKSARKWDYLISPNRYSSTIFRRAFQFEGKLLETGYPRNDYLVNENNPDEIARLKVKLNLPKDKKIILYAPTWRDNEYHEKGRYKFDIPFDMHEMETKLGDDYVVLFRMHYLIAEQLDLSAYKRFAFDLSFHEDIRELYLIADMLITDYSSVFFDYAILKRPILFYVYDMEEYRDHLRGFYFDFEKEAPGPLVKTTKRLIEEIKTLNSELSGDTQTNDAFYEAFCSLEDGKASERVVNEVFGKQ